MSGITAELVQICERLPESQRAEVADFARFLLARNQNGTSADAAKQWLSSAAGAANAGMKTDEIMNLTRGEP